MAAEAITTIDEGRETALVATMGVMRLGVAERKEKPPRAKGMRAVEAVGTRTRVASKFIFNTSEYPKRTKTKVKA